MGKQLTIHILIGLPGSGKTTFARTFNPNIAKYVDLDENYGQHTIYRTIQQFQSFYRSPYTREYIVDGLILQLKDLDHVLNAIDVGLDDNDTAKIIIHYWHENREACRTNDSYRVNVLGQRRALSEVTIRHADYMSLDDIKKFLENEYVGPKYTYEYKEHEVHQMTDIDRILNKHVEYNGEGYAVINSERWSNGGNWVNYMGNSSSVGAESPKEFDELDEILNQLCPDITYLQYKKLHKQCVTLEEDDERDYYGGSISYSWWSCNVELLKDTLTEMGYLTENIN